MSYADVAAQNTTGSQPIPDPALFTTETAEPSPVVDDAAKVNVVPSSFKEQPATKTSEIRQELDERENAARRASHQGRRKDTQEGVYLWELTKRYLARPGVAGGLIGVGQCPVATPSILLSLTP